MTRTAELRVNNSDELNSLRRKERKMKISDKITNTSANFVVWGRLIAIYHELSKSGVLAIQGLDSSDRTGGPMHQFRGSRLHHGYPSNNDRHCGDRQLDKRPSSDQVEISLRSMIAPPRLWLVPVELRRFRGGRFGNYTMRFDRCWFVSRIHESSRVQAHLC